MTGGGEHLHADGQVGITSVQRFDQQQLQQVVGPGGVCFADIDDSVVVESIDEVVKIAQIGPGQPGRPLQQPDTDPLFGRGEGPLDQLVLLEMEKRGPTVMAEPVHHGRRLFDTVRKDQCDAALRSERMEAHVQDKAVVRQLRGAEQTAALCSGGAEENQVLVGQRGGVDGAGFDDGPGEALGQPEKRFIALPLLTVGCHHQDLVRTHDLREDRSAFRLGQRAGQLVVPVDDQLQGLGVKVQLDRGPRLGNQAVPGDRIANGGHRDRQQQLVRVLLLLDDREAEHGPIGP